VKRLQILKSWKDYKDCKQILNIEVLERLAIEQRLVSFKSTIEQTHEANGY
jgi:hypothetical protein